MTITGAKPENEIEKMKITVDRAWSRKTPATQDGRRLRTVTIPFMSLQLAKVFLQQILYHEEMEIIQDPIVMKELVFILYLQTARWRICRTGLGLQQSHRSPETSCWIITTEQATVKPRAWTEIQFKSEISHHFQTDLSDDRRETQLYATLAYHCVAKHPLQK